MRNSFGTFTTSQNEKEFLRYVFWNVLEYQVADKDSRNPKYEYLLIDQADQIIRDLSREPFRSYCKALELNGSNFHYRSFGYPAIEVFFIDPESVKEFHNTLKVWQTKYNLCPTYEDLKNNKTIETDWIPAKVCQFLWHWSEYPKDLEKLFLANSGSQMGFIDDSFPHGLEEFRAHFETPQIYAERMAEKVKSDLQSLESINAASKTAKNKVVADIKEKALKHAKDFQRSKLTEHPHLSPAKELPSLPKHFVWLIKTYILGKRFIDISNESPNEIDVAGISRNVKRLAEILGLPKPAHLKQGNPNLTSKP